MTLWLECFFCPEKKHSSALPGIERVLQFYQKQVLFLRMIALFVVEHFGEKKLAKKSLVQKSHRGKTTYTFVYNPMALLLAISNTNSMRYWPMFGALS